MSSSSSNGSSGSGHGVRLTIRQPPHRDFVSNWPGLSGLRGQPPGGSETPVVLQPDGSSREGPLLDAALVGTVEVRVANGPVMAHSLRLELKKTETVLTSKGLRRYFELIGSHEHVLWHAQGKEGADVEGFAPIETGDYAFSLPIPTGLPPSIVLDKSKNSGIVYQLVATLLVRPKTKGFFGSSKPGKGSAPVTQTSEVWLEKHELNPAWPIYAWQAEREVLTHSQGNLHLVLRRDTVMHGGGDPLSFTVSIRSQRTAPVKIAKLELFLRETILINEHTPHPGLTQPADARKLYHQTSDIVALKSSLQKLLYQHEEATHTLTGTFPNTHYRFTVQNAKHVEVKYHIYCRAVIETPKEGKSKKGDNRAKEEPVKELEIYDIPVLVSPWNRKHGDWWVQKIGQTPDNLARPNTAPRPPLGAVRSQQAIEVAPTNAKIPGAQPERPLKDGLTGTLPSGPKSASTPLLATLPPEAAAALEKGRRLSSFPPKPPSIGTPEQSDQNSLNNNKRHSMFGQARASASGNGIHMKRSPMSDSGHEYRRFSQFADFDDTPGYKQGIPMDGAYPMLTKNLSNGDAPRMPSILVHPAAAHGTETRVPSDSPGSRAARSMASPHVSAQSMQAPCRSSKPSGAYDPQATPVSSLPVAVSRKRESMLRPTAFTDSRRPMPVRSASGSSHAEMLRRKGTLSTITGSPPESPVSDEQNSLASSQGGTTTKTTSAASHQSWLSAEEEKERLFREAKATAQITQERLGQQEDDGVSSPVEAYKSVQGRSGTPLSLMRSVSNPIPSPTHASIFEAMVGPANDPPRSPLSRSLDRPAPQSQPEISPSSITGPTSHARVPSAPVTRPMSMALDEQKMRYLRALAAREAYQQRMAGRQPVPLTALEEKRQLQKLYDEESQAEAAMNGSSSSLSPEARQQRQASPPRALQDPWDASGQAAGMVTPAQSVYLTPATHSSNRAGFFESPHSSSSHLTSDNSHPTPSSASTHGMYRDPSIAQGKQRQLSVYGDDDGDAYSAQNTFGFKPHRPPKPVEILEDRYSHLDSPIEPVSPILGRYSSIRQSNRSSIAY